MREVWLKIKKFNKDLITSALESGIDAFYIDNKIEEETIEKNIKKLGKIKVYKKDSPELLFYKFKDKKDEEKILNLPKEKKIILFSENWQIIPWENLISKNIKFYIFANNEQDIKQASGVLEKGVFGIILEEEDINKIRNLIKISKFKLENINLTQANITEIKLLSSGERVCIDTCNIMNIGEGMLIGNSSECLFLIHSETIENPYCNTRPFRVNAGAVHAYVKINREKTKYLSEIEAGDDILIVNSNGKCRQGIVGRSKIETRPLVIIKAKVESNEYSVILQNAETINLVNANKQPVSVTKLKVGDKVLVELNKGGRHFGIKIEENIIEK